MFGKNPTLSSTTGGQHTFSNIPSANIPRSVFNRSCGVKTTFDAGFLVPVMVDEALPGDTISMQIATLARLATPIRPLMDNMYLDFHFWAVPVRLLWDNWEKFNGAQVDPGDSTSFLIPQQVSPGGGYDEMSLQDYMGIPPGIAGLTHSALFLRAYNLIWREWYRDENLQDSPVVDLDDGPDDVTKYVLLKRGKRKDYFTACLPFAQKGTAVGLPLGTSAPLIFPTANVDVVGGAGTGPQFDVSDLSDVHLRSIASSPGVGWGASATSAADADWKDPDLVFDAADLVGTADLTAATAATINELREAFQVQRLFERDARGGTRYTEVIHAHFGVTSPDARLQRPEYLGGLRQPVIVNPVPQTSASEPGKSLGDLAGYGQSASSGGAFVKSFTEHCVIIGLVSARADLNYQQGLDRMWSRLTRFDYYWPVFAHLGEQAVLNQEIFADGTANDALTFGFQERYAEYRYKPSLITGLFRSSASQALDVWHLAQDFASLPLLNASFIEENPPVDRTIAIPTQPHFLLDAFFNFKHARPMPVASVPGHIDHF